MRVCVTSIGERTTKLCIWQLQRLGYEVHVLDLVEPWIDKYKTFIELASELGGDWVRIDADVIVNKKIRDTKVPEGIYMAQYLTYDLYKNDVGITSPVFYSKEAIQIVKDNLGVINPKRPEATAWRLGEINPGRNLTIPEVVGIHGFYQDLEAVKRANANKISRGQDQDYDWEFVEKILELGL